MGGGGPAGIQFTCCTSTKVHILTPEEAGAAWNKEVAMRQVQYALEKLSFAFCVLPDAVGGCFFFGGAQLQCMGFS